MQLVPFFRLDYINISPTCFICMGVRFTVSKAFVSCRLVVLLFVAHGPQCVRVPSVQHLTGGYRRCFADKRLPSWLALGV